MIIFENSIKNRIKIIGIELNLQPFGESQDLLSFSIFFFFFFSLDTQQGNWKDHGNERLMPRETNIRGIESITEPATGERTIHLAISR